MAHLPDGIQMFDFVGGPYYGPLAAYSTNSTWGHRAGMQERSLRDARSFYFKTPKPQTIKAHRVRRGRRFRGSEGLTFVWHVRGGDMTPPDGDFIIAGLKTLKHKYGQQMQSLDFISVGMPSQYQKIIDFCSTDLGVSCSVLLHQDGGGHPTQHHVEELQEDFHRMVMADVYVYSKSTLASSAAILNAGATHLDTDLAKGKHAHQSFRAKSFALESVLVGECGVIPFAEQQ